MYDRDEEMVRLRIEPRFGAMKLTQVTRKMVQQFHTDLLAEGLKPATADHYLKLMRQSWNLAVAWSMLESSPLTKLALFNQDNRVENLLTDAQLESLVTILRTDANRAVCNVCLFLLSTGCRLNEALAATWDQVDIENRVWRITWISQVKSSTRVIAITGSQDQTTPSQLAKTYIHRLQKREVDASFILVPEAGHIDILRTQAITDAIARFLSIAAN